MIGSLFANALYTLHQGQSGGRGLSPRLWGKAYGQMLSPDGASNAFMIGDDFLNFGGHSPAIDGTTALPSATIPGPNGYGVYTDTTTSACSIAPIATASGGVCRIATGATDNHEAWLTAMGNLGVFGAISDTAGSDKLTIFEARVRVGQVANNGGAFFLGLAEEGLAAADTKADDTGVMASKDFIGFNTIHSDGDLLSINYRKAGADQQSVGSGSALTASTWTKLGFVYDPKEVASKRIKFFIDNVEQSDYVTGDNIAASTFPDGEELVFLAGIKNGGAAASTLDIDWWQFFQAG